MNTIQLLLFIVFSCSALGEEAPNPVDTDKKRFIDLEENDLVVLRNNAIKGDGDAAYQVFLYYSSKTKTGIEGFEWLIIAVRNKNPNALKSFIILKNQGVIDTWVKMLIDDAALQVPDANE